MAEDIDDILDELASQPQRVQGDNGNAVEMPSIPDVIALDKYRRAKEAVNTGGLGIRLSKLIPPGAD